MTITLPLLAALVAAAPAPPAADRDTERRVAELARQVADEGLDPDQRELAAEELGSLGPLARAAVPGLLKALHAAYVGPHAAGALLKIDPDNKEAVPALVKAVERPGGDVRCNACFVLAAFGER